MRSDPVASNHGRVLTLRDYLCRCPIIPNRLHQISQEILCELSNWICVRDLLHGDKHLVDLLVAGEHQGGP